MNCLPTKKFQAMVPLLREKGYYVSQEQKKISWPEYNLNQIQDLKESLVFIRKEVESCECLEYRASVSEYTSLASQADISLLLQKRNQRGSLMVGLGLVGGLIMAIGAFSLAKLSENNYSKANN